MTIRQTANSQRGRTLDRLVRPFGVTAAAILTGFAGFQTALAMGAPWGEHVWGGAFTGQLSPGMRVASVLATLLLAGMTTVVLARANVVRRLASWRPLTGVTWAIAGYMALNTLGNMTSSSDVEKYLFGAATLVMAVLIGFVAWRGPKAAAAITSAPSRVRPVAERR